MKPYIILLVSNETNTFDIITDCFERTDSIYTFYKATNGKEALRITRELYLDLIITDWVMPVMDGLQLIFHLKKSEKTREIPVVMLTGKMSSSEDLATALKAGAIAYFRKPIDKVELVARIYSILETLDSFKEAIDLKNRDLLKASIHIAQNNEFNIKLEKRIVEIETKYGSKDTELKLILSELKNEISHKPKSETWNQFDMHLKEVHPDFHNHLITTCPAISPAELKLAAFLRLNMPTKDIASIMFLTVDSVRTARTRLRKKLNLKESDNLTVFLLSL